MPIERVVAVREPIRIQALKPGTSESSARGMESVDEVHRHRSQVILLHHSTRREVTTAGPRVRPSLWVAALTNMAKHLGLLKDLAEHSGTLGTPDFPARDLGGDYRPVGALPLRTNLNWRGAPRVTLNAQL